jgi:hypothetical protein
MATLNQVRDAMHTQPFRPFTLRFADGHHYTVRHPDFVALPDRGREMVLYERGANPDEPVMHRIDLGLVLEIYDATQHDPEPAGGVQQPTT